MGSKPPRYEVFVVANQPTPVDEILYRIIVHVWEPDRIVRMASGVWHG